MADSVTGETLTEDLSKQLIQLVTIQAKTLDLLQRKGLLTADEIDQMLMMINASPAATDADTTIVGIAKQILEAFRAAPPTPSQT